MSVEASTGNSYGEKRTATTQPFHKMDMAWNGLLHRPRLHAGLGNCFGVQKRRPRDMRPYAAADGTPAAETRDVKATGDGRMVQVIREETAHTTMTAFRGCPSTTVATQGEKGRTPSRATAKTKRDAARIAMAVFFVG